MQVVGRNTSQIGLHTKVGNVEVRQVQEFVYLGGTVSSDATFDKDILRRIGIASGVAQNLEKVWKAKDISTNIKVLVYCILVQSILLYNAETWILKEVNKRSLRNASLRCQWQGKYLAVQEEITGVMRTY